MTTPTEHEAMNIAIMEHLGVAALTGGTMSVLQAFELGWQARAALASPPASTVEPVQQPAQTTPAIGQSVDALAQEIRRVDGCHILGAGALAEALMPFIAASLAVPVGADAGQPAGVVRMLTDEEVRQCYMCELDVPVSTSLQTKFAEVNGWTVEPS